MAFELFCYSPDHIEIGCDEGHHFVYEIVRGPEGQSTLIRDMQWNDARHPLDTLELLASASRYALICARELGLA